MNLGLRKKKREGGRIPFEAIFQQPASAQRTSPVGHRRVQSNRLFWTLKVHHGQSGCPPVSKEIRQGELLELGIDIGETSLSLDP
jgi:hypothetical protein